MTWQLTQSQHQHKQALYVLMDDEHRVAQLDDAELANAIRVSYNAAAETFAADRKRVMVTASPLTVGAKQTTCLTLIVPDAHYRPQWIDVR